MSTRDDLETFLLTDVSTVVTVIDLDANDVYLGQQIRNNAGDYEIRIGYNRFEDLQRDQGARRHFVDIEVQSREFEDQREDQFSRLVFGAAEEIKIAYDTAIDRFSTGMANVEVERVRAVISDRVSVESSGYERRATVSLELDEWE